MNFFKRQQLSNTPQMPLFSRLNEEMNRFFDRDFPALSSRWDVLGGEWQPDIDVEQKSSEYIVRADLPGVDVKDIKVAMDNGMLTIEGKRETKAEENKENFRCIERSYGSFYRSFALPEAVVEKNIKAHCHNGVLEITVPKAKSAKLKEIPIISD
jgi:HSP20 family protein